MHILNHLINHVNTVNQSLWQFVTDHWQQMLVHEGSVNNNWFA